MKLKVDISFVAACIVYLNLEEIAKGANRVISQELAKYQQLPPTKGGIGLAKTSCNESTYLRVVEFRESMHDDDSKHPVPLPPQMIYRFPSESAFPTVPY